MSGFSAEWLALREPIDRRSRSGEIAQALTARYQSRNMLEVVDLGSGTGSNLRATAPLLPGQQTWTLVDYDAALLQAARTRLMDWADDATAAPDGGLDLHKDGKRIVIRFRQADLNRDLDVVLSHKPALVTASAFFDLCSAGFIKRFARSVSELGAAFYTVLTYNGIQRWKPRHPSDNAMIAAFHAHQMTDKGFGPSAGPTAPAHLADAFRLAGYTVQEGDSPWILDARDRELIAQLAAGFATAVQETAKVDAREIDAWAKVERLGAEVGHTDTLAAPG